MSTDLPSMQEIDLSVRKIRTGAPSDGQSKIWLVGGGLAVCLTLVVGLFAFILLKGMSVFWPRPIVLLETNDGQVVLGEPIDETETSVVYRLGNLDLTGRQYRSFKVPQAGRDLSNIAYGEKSVLDENGTSNKRTEYSHSRSDGDPIADHQAVPENPVQPMVQRQWNPSVAVKIERQQWGAMFGVPLLLHEDLSRSLLPWNSPLSTEIRHLKELRRLLATSESPKPTLDLTLKELELRTTNSQLRRELANIKEEPATGTTEIATGNSSREHAIRVLLAAEDGEMLRSALDETATSTDSVGQVETKLRWEDFAASKLSEDRRVVAAYRQWESVDSILATLPSRLAIVRAIKRETESVRSGMVRLDVRLDTLTKRVRNGLREIDADAVAEIERWRTLIRSNTQLLQSKRSIDFAKQSTNELRVDHRQDWIEWIESASQALEEEQTRLDRELSKWSQSQNSEIAVALFEEYSSQVSDISAQQWALTQKLSSLQNALGRWQIFVAVTSGSELRGDTPLANETRESGTDSESLRRLEVLTQNDETGGDALSIWQETGVLRPFGHMDAPGLSELDEVGEAWSANERNAYLTIHSSVEDGGERTFRLVTHREPLQNVVTILPSNRLSWRGRLATYIDRWREFLFENPREANTAGGMFPAIWGTAVLTLMMTMAVVPFGVIAALYLREYTNEGPLVSLIRISIHNLAGVPSIVYGVFGVAFFCYTVGAFIDGGPKNADIQPLSLTRWYLLFGMTSLVGTLAFFSTFGFAKFGRGLRQWFSRSALILWLVCFAGIVFLIFKSPFFEGFYVDELPNPTFGKGGILWAALTLALLTLPIVIVTTEEALVGVPNSLRIGSSACGANKWQTIQRVVFPQALPGIATGALLAMARGAGQVAPLMLVGALPSVADLPLDTEFPFLHGSRSFMHLGYQIYSLGLKSGDAQATEPFVFAAILLLLSVVCVLHLTASLLRSALMKKQSG